MPFNPAAIPCRCHQPTCRECAARAEVPPKARDVVRAVLVWRVPEGQNIGETLSQQSPLERDGDNR